MVTEETVSRNDMLYLIADISVQAYPETDDAQFKKS